MSFPTNRITLKISELIQIDTKFVDYVSPIWQFKILTKYYHTTYNFFLVLTMEAYFSSRVLVRVLIDYNLHLMNSPITVH